MDSLTHTVLGACLGEAIAGKKLGKKAMLFGALINNFPDVDVLASPFVEPAHNLLVHRGITHSLLACTLLTFFFAWLFSRLFRKDGLSMQRWLMLMGSGLFLHILMDAFTSYGTGWFEPFSSYRVSFNTLFIIDPFFLLPLLIGAIVLLIKKRTSETRLRTAQIVLWISFIYLGLTIGIKLIVDHKVKNDLALQNVPHNDYMSTPTPLNNILWYIVARNNDSCRLSYYSLFDKAGPLEYQAIPRREELLRDVEHSPEVRDLVQFSKSYYSVSKTDSSVLFSDIRFGQIGGWYDTNAVFVFNFDIMHRNSSTHIQQGRIRSVGSKPLEELLKRIKGK